MPNRQLSELSGPESASAMTGKVDPERSFGAAGKSAYFSSSSSAFAPFGSLTTLLEKPVKIGAKVVRHGRYITFQLAEVAIPRALFSEILTLIAGLRGPPPKPA